MRSAQESRGHGDVCKRQGKEGAQRLTWNAFVLQGRPCLHIGWWGDTASSAGGASASSEPASPPHRQFFQVQAL